MIRVAVLCRNSLFCESLSLAFRNDPEVELLNTSIEPVEDIVKSSPEIVIVDAGMFHEVLPAFANSPIKILILGENIFEDGLNPFLFENVIGIIGSSTTIAMLKKALKAVANGEVWINRKDIRGVISSIQAFFKNLEKQGISKREREVIKYVAKGYTNREIAEALHISEQTVKCHLSRIYKKLGINNRLHLALYYLHSLLPTNG